MACQEMQRYYMSFLPLKWSITLCTVGLIPISFHPVEGEDNHKIQGSVCCQSLVGQVVVE